MSLGHRLSRCLCVPVRISVIIAAGVVGGCGDDGSKPTDPSVEGNSNLRTELTIPPRENPDPGLPDSCELLLSGDPQSMIDEPLTPLERMSDLCLVAAKSTPTLERSITVEVRRPTELEMERGGVPTNEELFWLQEGGGIDLVGGRREQIQEIEGLGDYAVWYPIKDGMALHTYWDGNYITAINIRGVDMDRSLEWAKETAQKAIDATQALPSEESGEAAPAS